MSIRLLNGKNIEYFGHSKTVHNDNFFFRYLFSRNSALLYTKWHCVKGTYDRDRDKK
jgi:hypothetical protein